MIENIDATLREVETVLADITGEDQVLAALQAALGTLRDSYAHDPAPFTAAHIARLKELAKMERALDIFVTVRTDLESPDDPEDLAELRAELVKIACSLGPAAVRQRVDKEIRQLDELRPSLELQAGDRAELDERTRLNALARHPPRCAASRHRMRLCSTDRGSYWACAAYPKCEHRQWLDRDERGFLEGDTDASARLEQRWHRAEQADPMGP